MGQRRQGQARSSAENVEEKQILKMLEEKLAPGNAELFTIDVQNDFCNSEAPPAKMYGRDVSMHVQMIDGILRLVDEARRSGLPIIHILNEEPAWSVSKALQEQRQRRRAKRSIGFVDNEYSICHPGTFGADFFRLKPEPQDLIVRKHRYDVFIGIDLDIILRSLNRKSIVFCGGATNICLKSTVRHSFILDYYCVVVGDCSPTPWGEKAYQALLENIELGFGQVVSLNQTIEAWSRFDKKSASIRTFRIAVIYDCKYKERQNRVGKLPARVPSSGHRRNCTLSVCQS